MSTRAAHASVRVCAACRVPQVLIFGEPVGPVSVHVTLDGNHVANSPAALEIEAACAVAGRCYAFGPGLGSSGPINLSAVARFTIVACDVTGTRRKEGGDPFKVRISPKQSAHHLALRLKLHDGDNGAYAVSWVPPFSGGYLVHITLNGLPIFGSPFAVTVAGGGQYAFGPDLAKGITPPPSRDETEKAVARVPSPTQARPSALPAPLRGFQTLQRSTSASSCRMQRSASASSCSRGTPSLGTAPQFAAMSTATAGVAAATGLPPWAQAVSGPMATPTKSGVCAAAPSLGGGVPFSVLATPSIGLVGVSSPGATIAAPERHAAAADGGGGRREALGDIINKFKRSIATDDAEEEHARALRSIASGAGDNKLSDDGNDDFAFQPSEYDGRSMSPD